MESETETDIQNRNNHAQTDKIKIIFSFLCFQYEGQC